MPVVRIRIAARFLLAVTVLASGAGTADVVIPSSAFSAGQNSAEFHSDVRVFNPTNAPVNVTPVFYNQANGQTVAAPAPGFVTVPARGQLAFDNVLATLFLQAKGVFGPIRFQTPAPIIVSSGVNNVNSCGNGSTSGQWLPGIDVGQALKAGTLVQLAASADGGSGYRSNVVFMNPGTADANVTTSLRRGDGTLVARITLDPLPANGFKQIGTLSAWLPSPNTITDTNLWLEFISDQPVLAFASVINNKSGDPFAIVMTAEPNVSAPVPVATYTVSANPTTGQPVTFTDTSSNSPTTQLWAFGDGQAATSGATVQHTYGAAATYRTTHFVANASGTSAAVKDVVVVAGGPTAITITGSSHGSTNWDWQPSPVSLKVGQQYTLTFRADPSENLTHGIGGLAVLGITQCDQIPVQVPCIVNFTPTTSMVGSWTYACTKIDCAPVRVKHDNMTGVLTIVP
ncbi:MAG: PKD domain-containing protein [Acidobacteriota bacterium]|nr:PKD domain-containing protein [Acidobacteriota bacterium]